MFTRGSYLKKTVWWPFNTGTIIMIEYGIFTQKMCYYSGIFIVVIIEKTELFRRIVLI